MIPILSAVAVLVFFGSAAFVLQRRPGLSACLGGLGPVLAALLSWRVSFGVLLGDAPVWLQAAWSMPLGTFSVGLDALSAFFLILILGLSALVAVYGIGYFRPAAGGRPAGGVWFCFNILVAGMMLVCLVRNALLFLVAWEIMALSSFFLVAFDYERDEVRRASWTYLVAAHLGTAFLLPLFLILGGPDGSQELGAVGRALSPGMANLCFVLALIGFGTKAGIMPLHVWLPEAHPAAPSPVSALMSGVMIKTGIYGFLRILPALGAPPLWWGLTLLAVGAVSGVLGVLFALAQHDLKRLLAYHSVENIGIIMLGLGTGLVGLSLGAPAVAALGFAGGLLHVLNHALFKGLLFLGAGSVLHATGTREIDRLGGLLKKMPDTGLVFLVGAAAICGLPPLNGFVSEFLVMLGALNGIAALSAGPAAALAGVMASLALIGGLAAACFTKAFGVVFLGESRAVELRAVHESNVWMRLPMLVLAAACVGIGVFGWAVVSGLSGLVKSVAGSAIGVETTSALFAVTMGAAALLGLIGLLAGLRRWLLFRRPRTETDTWGCGYLAPSSRMQYTASSFAQPLADLFLFFLRTRKHARTPDAVFPGASRFDTETPDVSRETVYRPLFEFVAQMLGRFRVFQEGRIQVYVLYIVVTLLVLLLWQWRRL
ncbi:MAG: hypothetical protein HY343_12905 [Lentisphaerae bacterium]|nr:hypothetical protein [Lentisphaerota bacterium]